MITLQIYEHPLHKAANTLGIFFWHYRSFLGKGYSGSLGRSAETGVEAYSHMHYLIEIFTANNRPKSPKSFYKFNGLRLQKINSVYSQKKKKEKLTV